jgi:LacI family transcriptional regulator
MTAPRRVGMVEVARHAGVSVATVSHVVNGSRAVRPETHRKVTQAMADLGFVRNGTARQLKLGRSNTIGAIVLDMGNPYFTELARGIEDRLNQDNGTLILTSSDENADRESELLDLLAEQGVRGIVITPSRGSTVQTEHLRRLGLPVVLMAGDQLGLDLPTVGLDDVEGGRLGLEHLISRGHSVIGFINDSHDLPHCAARSRGALEAAAAASREVELVEVLIEEHGSAGGERAMQTLLAREPRVTAGFCYNDITALGAMRAVRKAGLTVPDDVAVLGYDDVYFAAELTVPLSSVRQPNREMGWAAADILMNPPLETPHLVFQPELVIREST